MSQSNVRGHDGPLPEDRLSNAARHPVIYALAEVALLCLLGLLFYGVATQV